MVDYVAVVRQQAPNGVRSLVGDRAREEYARAMSLRQSPFSSMLSEPELEEIPVTEGLTFSLSAPKTIRRPRR